MAPNFRYRYVDFGTVFAAVPRERSSHSGVESTETLFANELATDVGGTCWGVNEPLAVIDHNFLRESQFPSASAAVLHKAGRIRSQFAERAGTLWLVTHKEPDFDAFCSMYLARWIVENPNPPDDWQAYGLHPEGWIDVPGRPKIDWLNVDLTAAPAEIRWALLLAGYASRLETRQPIACPRQRTLRSILYAALKRGRNYLSETSGATEFFNAVRAVLEESDLNPVFDAVLESSSLFAPELNLLDREAEAYLRDIARARRATVYLPESEAPSPDFFKSHKHQALQEQRPSPEIDAEHLLLADTFRIPSDGIYLLDPECALFKEWARLDLENSTLGAGFEFTAIAYSHGRPEAAVNKTNYSFSIDPERASGRHLYTVWSRLQTQEVEALRAHEEKSALAGSRPGIAFNATTTLGTLLADPWSGGQTQYGTSVESPRRGTFIGPPGVLSSLRDDPVVEAVRTELEGSIYSAVSLVAGPQVTVFDFAATKDAVDIVPRQFNLNTPLEIPPPHDSYFRFANIRLRADVPLGRNLDAQIADTLWQVLYPEVPGAVPPGFVAEHVVVRANSVSVWADRGIAIALKSDVVGAPDRQLTALRNDFHLMVSLARDVDRLTGDWTALNNRLAPETDSPGSSTAAQNADALQALLRRSEDLSRRASEVNHFLTLPDRDLFRLFHKAVGIDHLLATWRDISIAVSERLRRHDMAGQEKQNRAREAVAARVQRRLKWLEVFAIGFLSAVAIDVITRHVDLGAAIDGGVLLLGGPLVTALAAWILKPWRSSKVLEKQLGQPAWIVVAVALASVAAWLAGLLQLWSK